MIGRSGERGSGISVLAARHDDDIYIYIYIYRSLTHTMITHFCIDKNKKYECVIVKIYGKNSLWGWRSLLLIHGGGIIRGVVVNVLDYLIIVASFVFQSFYYDHFQTNTSEKDIEFTYLSRDGSNITTAVLQQGWLRCLITHECWYAIKPK